MSTLSEVVADFSVFSWFSFLVSLILVISLLVSLVGQWIRRKVLRDFAFDWSLLQADERLDQSLTSKLSDYIYLDLP